MITIEKYEHYKIYDAIRFHTLPNNFTGIIKYENGSKQTFLNGCAHSFDDEPADIDAIRRENRWYNSGQLHRVGLPSLVCDDAVFEYRLNGHFYFGSGYKERYSIKQYWTNCWNVYRTQENEHLIMAGLLSSK